MARFTDHSYVDVAWDARPEIARTLIDAAKGLGADHQDPMVLASTSEGFRVRNDVLAATDLAEPAEPAESAEPAAGSAAEVAAPKDAEKAAAQPAPAGKATGKSGKPGRKE